MPGRNVSRVSRHVDKSQGAWSVSCRAPPLHMSGMIHIPHGEHFEP